MSVDPPEGWYDDPDGSETVRWWDGREWTDHVQYLATATLEPPKDWAIPVGTASQDWSAWRRHRGANTLVTALWMISLLDYESHRHWRDPITYCLLAVPVVGFALSRLRRQTTDGSQSDYDRARELFRATRGMKRSERMRYLNAQGFYGSSVCAEHLRRQVRGMAYFALYLAWLLWFGVRGHQSIGYLTTMSTILGLFVLLGAWQFVRTRQRHIRALSERPPKFPGMRSAPSDVDESGHTSDPNG